MALMIQLDEAIAGLDALHETVAAAYADMARNILFEAVKRQY